MEKEDVSKHVWFVFPRRSRSTFFGICMNSTGGTRPECMHENTHSSIIRNLHVWCICKLYEAMGSNNSLKIIMSIKLYDHYV